MRFQPKRHEIARSALALLLALGAAYALPGAQTAVRKGLTVEDYSRWRSISGQEISGDGSWVAYELSFTNTVPAGAKPVLHLVRLETSLDTEIPNATGGTFSADSRWIAYQVDPSGGRGRGGRGGRGNAGGTAPTGVTSPPDGAPTTDAPPPPPVGDAPPGEQAPATTPGQAPATVPGQAPSTGSGQAAQGARGAGAARPVPPTRVELRNLSTGAVQSWQDIESFTFSANSSHLILRRKPATSAGAAGGRGGAGSETSGAGGGGPGAAGGGGDAPSGPRGADVILHNLMTGRDQLLGSVGDIAFNKAGDLLAYTVDAAVKDGNGLFVLDLKEGRVNTLDNDARSYNRLTWSEDGAGIAVLKGLDPAEKAIKMRERENVLIVFPDVRAALTDVEAVQATLDPAKAVGFPKGWVVSDRAPLSWSDDNKRVFFGAKEQVPAPDAGPRKSTDDVANVDVWNTMDERIQSMQMIRADADRNFTFRQAFDVSGAKFVKLADATMRDLDVAPDGRWAVGRDTRGYVHDYKRAAADIYRVNTSTGERTLMLNNQLVNTSTGSHTFGISPDGHYFLYWKDNRFQVYDLDTTTTQTLGAGSPGPNVSFVDLEFDHPGPKPSYGIAGYTGDHKSVIVQHRYDLWQFPLDGSAPRNLTNGVGSRNEIRFRYVRTEPLDPAQPGGGAPGGGGGGGRGGGAAAARATIDLSKPITLSAYGDYTKKAGFYELANGQLKELVYEDAAFSNPTKAAKADTYLFTRQTFVEFPDLRVSGPGFKDSKKISAANPQQAEFVWGHRILFDFKNKDGIRLQGILAVPDDYKPGEKRPMLVSFYEKNSQNLHRYSPPSYLTGMGSLPMQAVSQGYLTMLPDVHFRTGASHSDMLECVEAATRKVIEMGYADPRRIGINGHSYGGEGAAFIGTRSRLFAAVGMGAGVTDLFFDFNQNWGWSYQVTGGSGANGSDYYLYSQGREGVSPWDKPEMYYFESALMHAPEVTAPFLIMHGTADPTVAFTNGLAMYNALRYNRKNAVLLAYPGEGHGLRGIANRKDLTIRYFQFFDHYLKDAPAPTWMTEGVPFLNKDAKRDPGPQALLPQQLPPPFHTPWFRKATQVVAMPDGHQLTVPAGFTVNIFADHLQFARFMALAPNGDVFLAEPFRGAGKITVLRDADKDGVAETRETFATGLNRPFGLAFWKNYLYVGNNDSVVRFTYKPGQTAADGPPEKIVDLPPSDAALDQDTADRLHIDLNQTRGYNHWTRNVVFNPAGTKMYVTVGSATNATPETDQRRAAINEYSPDGTSHRVFAGGLRNPVGLAYFPGSNTLWTAVNERDQLGDDLVPDYITSVRDGGFYGWPYSYIGQHLDPTVKAPRPDLVAKAIVPDVLLTSHSAALGLIFYTGSQFPAEYRNSAFVALHGSINRSKLSGYAVARVPFVNGQPSGPPEDFLSGFIARDDQEKQAWGRPVGLLQLPDGSLLVSDDGGNRVWRVSYPKK